MPYWYIAGAILNHFHGQERAIDHGNSKSSPVTHFVQRWDQSTIQSTCFTEDGNLLLEAAPSLISSKTVEQLSNLDQVDHLSTNRTLRGGDSAVHVVYFDVDDAIKIYVFLAILKKKGSRKAW